MRSVITLAILVATALAQYNIVDDYTEGNFADEFTFFTGNDPTNGYVNYVDYQTAASTGLYRQNSNNVYIGVDHNNTASGRGRNSVRIASNKSYQHGLIILDLAHMPGGACGTWPAFWLLSTTATWPNGGEVDIIEGVNDQSYNNMAVHTNAGCSLSSTYAQSMSGQVVTDNCNVNAPNQATNQGCSIKASNSNTYGTGFNANGGGVYATEWTSNGITIWYFPRNSIPSDISSGSPNPSGWGTPLSRFAGDCNWDQKVVNQQIIFDVTFCGDWAGAVFSTDAACSSKASTCQAYVQNNPGAFTNTYWSINSLKVYQENGAAATSSVSTISSSSTRTATTTLSATSVVVTTFVTVTAPGSSTTSTSTSSSKVSTTLSTTSYATLSTTTPYTTSSTTSILSKSSSTTSPYTTTSSSIYTTFSTITTSIYTTPSTTTIPATTYTTSYWVNPSSSWHSWTMGVTPGVPSAVPSATDWGSPNTFFTVTKPWSGGPSGNWGPPSNPGPSGWGGHGGPGGPGGFGGPP